jgi:hypothetical protein
MGACATITERRRPCTCHSRVDCILCHHITPCECEAINLEPMKPLMPSTVRFTDHAEVAAHVRRAVSRHSRSCLVCLAPMPCSTKDALAAALVACELEAERETGRAEDFKLLLAAEGCTCGENYGARLGFKCQVHYITAARERHDALSCAIMAFKQDQGTTLALKTALAAVEKAGEHQHFGTNKPYPVGKACPGGGEDCLVHKARELLGQ